MLLHVTLPPEPFNSMLREGSVGETITRILEATKPEAAYFTEHSGSRGAVLVVQVDHASEIPALAEPWFLSFEADCEFRIAMTPEDLKRSNLEDLGRKY